MNAHLIDDVARRMTDIAPQADLRARLVARLPERHAPARLWRPALMTPVAAFFVALAIGATTMRQSSPVASMPLPASPIALNAPIAALPVSVIAGATPVRRSRPTGLEISPAEAAWRARAIPAIAAPEPATMPDIQPETLQLPLLALKPLVTVPVIVAPIAATDLPEGR